MAEAITEKAVCVKCGADERENTQFCYSCGSRRSDANDDAVEPETPSALDDLAERLKLDEESADQMAKAAAKRKQARVSHRKRKEVVWEAQEDSPGRLILLIALLITVLTAAAVLINLYWR